VHAGKPRKLGVDTGTRLAHPTGKLDPAAGLNTSNQLARGTELTSILATDTLGPPENSCTLWQFSVSRPTTELSCRGEPPTKAASPG